MQNEATLISVMHESEQGEEQEKEDEKNEYDNNDCSSTQWITTSRHFNLPDWNFIFINIYKHWFPLNSANDQIKPVFVFVDVNRFLCSCSCPIIMLIIAQWSCDDTDVDDVPYYL